MRVLQCHDATLDAALSAARPGDTIALALDSSHGTWQAAKRSGYRVAGWWQAARDPEAANQWPEWMHAPQHGEWLRRFPDIGLTHPAVVWPYIGLGTVAPYKHALERFVTAASVAEVDTIYLADIQGPPMGCGCGNPACRSWDNAPGEKIAPSAYHHPEVLFPLRFFQEVKARITDRRIIPVLCPECERGILMDGVEDPDGPDGTDLCQGVLCMSPCSREFFPRLLAAFREAADSIALVLTVDALCKNHPLFGEPRAWAKRAWRHYGSDLLPVVEPEDADAFPDALIAFAYDQSVEPRPRPAGYRPSEPPVACGGSPSCDAADSTEPTSQ